MKRIIAVLIALSMALGLSACGNLSDLIYGEDAEDEVLDFSSLEELNEAGDCALVRPEGLKLTDESYHIILKEPKIIEYDFVLEGHDCFLRFSKAGRDVDISGLLSSYDAGGTLLSDPEFEGIRLDCIENFVWTERWFTDAGQYVFVAFYKDEKPSGLDILKNTARLLSKEGRKELLNRKGFDAVHETVEDLFYADGNRNPFDEASMEHAFESIGNMSASRKLGDMIESESNMWFDLSSPFFVIEP